MKCHLIQQNHSLFKYSNAGIINLDMESDAQKCALRNFPTQIIKSTQKSHFQVITINNMKEMKSALLTKLMNISRIILSEKNNSGIILQYSQNISSVIQGESRAEYSSRELFDINTTAGNLSSIKSGFNIPSCFLHSTREDEEKNR